MANAKLECHIARPHALPYEVAAFILIYWLMCVHERVVNTRREHGERVKDNFPISAKKIQRTLELNLW